MHAAVHCFPLPLADSAVRRLLRIEACLVVRLRRIAVIASKPSERKVTSAPMKRSSRPRRQEGSIRTLTAGDEINAILNGCGYEGPPISLDT